MEASFVTVTFFIFSPALGSTSLPYGAGMFFEAFALGLLFYIIGILWTIEFRMLGFCVILGTPAIAYLPGNYHGLIFFLCVGLGHIIAGLLMRRRWLRLREGELPSETDLEFQGNC